jgi:tight adherence protein C
VDAAHPWGGGGVDVSLLALGWGVLAALPVLAFARRQRVLVRVRGLAPPPPCAGGVPRRRAIPLPAVLRTFVLVLGAPGRRRARRARDAAARRALPVAIDLLAVATGAGCTPYLALDVAARWCPPEISAELAAVPSACRLGGTFDGALRAMAHDAPALRPIADTLAAAARLGAPVAPTLERLSAEARADLRRAAETRARTVPVRLLFPLVFFVLPAFALLTIAPVLLDGLAAR